MAVVNEKNIITTYLDYVSNAPIITFPGYDGNRITYIIIEEIIDKSIIDYLISFRFTKSDEMFFLYLAFVFKIPPTPF